jgi:hypothetical protein
MTDTSTRKAIHDRWAQLTDNGRLDNKVLSVESVFFECQRGINKHLPHDEDFNAQLLELAEEATHLAKLAIINRWESPSR